MITVMEWTKKRLTPSNSMKNKFYYTWSQFHDDCVEGARLLKDWPIDNIYAIPRSGLIVGAVMANFLDKPMIIRNQRITEKTLVVDDMCDTGRTLRHLANKTKCRFRTFVLFDKDNELFQVDLSMRRQGQWIVFPWEINLPQSHHPYHRQDRQDHRENG